MMLSDTEMTRFGEFLDGCPPTVFLYRDGATRSSLTVDGRHHEPLHSESADRSPHCHDVGMQRVQEHDRAEEREHEQEQDPERANVNRPKQLTPSRPDRAVRKLSQLPRTDECDKSDCDTEWTLGLTSTRRDPVAISSCDVYSSVTGRSGCDAIPHDPPPYFEMANWPVDDSAVEADPSYFARMPFDSVPATHGDAHRIPLDSLDRCAKEGSAMSCTPTLTTPSPAHMEHFMPFVHPGEPEMIFTGIELGCTEFQSLHFTHPPGFYAHYPHQSIVTNEQRQHGQLFFPAAMAGGDGDGVVAEPFATPMQALMLPLESVGSSRNALGLDDGFDTVASHGRDHDAPAGMWSAAASSSAATGFLAPTHFITSDSRESPLAAESVGLKAKTRSRTVISVAPRTRSLGSARTRRGTAASVPTAVAEALEVHASAGIDAIGSAFPVSVELVTVLSDCYWKNGRKNLQCFPVCPEHNDFYSMKMNNRKHSSVGVCRGPVYCEVVADAADGVTFSGSAGAVEANIIAVDSDSESALPPVPFPALRSQRAPATPSPPLPSQHMKYEYGVGASGSGGSARELFVLGRFERVPQRDNMDLEGQLGAPPAFGSSAVFEEFRYSCFQAAELEDKRIAGNAGAISDGRVRSTWCFLPDVWKVQPTLKKKRKATRSAPAQTFPFCFRVFVYVRAVHGGYVCVAARASSFFELYSTRTVDRVKRKRSVKSSSGGGGSEATKSAKRQAVSVRDSARALARK